MKESKIGHLAISKKNLFYLESVKNFFKNNFQGHQGGL